MLQSYRKEITRCENELASKFRLPNDVIEGLIKNYWWQVDDLRNSLARLRHSIVALNDAERKELEERKHPNEKGQR